MEKIKSHLGGIGIVILSILLIVVIAANVGLSRYSGTITYYTNLAKHVEDVSDVDKETQKLETFKEARDVTLETASEGTTLLKNSLKSLPLQSSKINVFGYSSVNIVYGGAGSGSTSGAPLNETLKESFEGEGLEINSDLWSYYHSKYTQSSEWDVFNPNGADFALYDSKCNDLETQISGAKDFSNIAVVVLSRVGGEGQDCPLDMADYADVGGDAGKHYLELQDCEKDLLDLVTSNFDNVIVLINSSHPMELGFLDDNKIDAALQIAGTGSTGLRGVANILQGKVNPSGHLVDTYAYDMKSAPSFYNMGDCYYTDYEKTMSDKYFYFEENIYVGYRWYETAAQEKSVIKIDSTVYNFADYEKIVQYPFGYGLSYTDFEWKIVGSKIDGKGGYITFKVVVTNTGSVAGKDVVQLYYNVPYIKGGVEKSAINLGAFTKTKELAPGESETVELSMVFDEMASFDYINNECYILDKGDYTFSLRTDSHTLKSLDLSVKYNVSNTIVYNTANNGKRSSDKIVAESQQEFIDAGNLETNVKYLSRSNFSSTFPQVERRLNPTSIPSEVKKRLDANGPGSIVMSLDDDNVPKPKMGIKGDLSIDDMKGLSYNDPKWETLLNQMTLDEIILLTGNAGWATVKIDSISKPETVDIDGPQGLNGFNFNNKGYKMNTYASEVLMGMSWNKNLVYKMGRIYGQEAKNWGIIGLYAPAMNTHRSPFGGRNFEYFSEDPLHAGLMASEEVVGIQEQGCYVYSKHYAMNTQDTNRDGVSNWCNEQAVREIYTRPFEIAIKIGHTTGLMTELSRVGTSWSSATYALCTVLPRLEWGMQGKIITDGVGPGGSYYMLPDYALRAGTSMMLTKASGKCGYTDVTLKTGFGLSKIRQGAKDILYIYANSDASEIYTYVSKDATWTWMWVLGNIILIALILSIFILLPFRAWCQEDNKFVNIINCFWSILVPFVVSLEILSIMVLILALTNFQLLSWSIGYILTSGTNATVIMPSVLTAVMCAVVFIATLFKNKIIEKLS